MTSTGLPDVPAPRYDAAVLHHLAMLRAERRTPPEAREASLSVLFDYSGSRFLMPTASNAEAMVMLAAARECGCSLDPVLLRRRSEPPVTYTRKPGGGYWHVCSLLADAPHVRVVTRAARQLGLGRWLVLRGDHAFLADAATMTRPILLGTWDRATAGPLVGSLLPDACLFAAGGVVQGARSPSVPQPDTSPTSATVSGTSQPESPVHGGATPGVG